MGSTIFLIGANDALTPYDDGVIIAPGMEIGPGLARRIKAHERATQGLQERKCFPMAAPQSFVPQRPSRSKSVRRFTLAEANRTLPLVKRIVADIVKCHAKAAGLRQRLATLENKNSQQQQHQQTQDELDKTIEQLQEFLGELGAVGAELKDFETGLIDFVGRHDGRDVHLCWKLGEDLIAHWHELDAGFAGRKPVSTLKEK